MKTVEVDKMRMKRIIKTAANNSWDLYLDHKVCCPLVADTYLAEHIECNEMLNFIDDAG